ncbi:MAG: protein kinase, partial [Planctomycetota bacterium]
PGNLLLDQRGTVKVLDMGLARMDRPARAADPTAPDALTQSGQVMGTYDYMAPEQAQDTHSADHRADIYSLGCTLFRLLTGRKPYVGETPVQILLAHCQEPVPSLCDVREDVPPRLDAVSQKMLAKDPAERQQSMGEVIAELEACLHPPGPEPPTPPPVQQPVSESSSSTDSALKAFLRKISPVGTATRQEPLSPDEETPTYHADAETAMPVGRPTVPSARRKKTTPWAIIGGIAGLLVILALGIVLLGRTPISEKPRESAGAKDRDQPIDFDAAPAANEPQSSLILRWPEADRADAKLSIDDLTYDLSGSWVQSAPDEIKIAVRPGPHKVWIARRGFEPIEDRFQAIAGKDYTIRPEWRTAAGLVERAEAKPEPESPTPTPTPTTSEVAESPQPSEPEPMEPETPALDPEAEKRLEAEARYAEAMKPVNDLIAAWDFNGASAALSKLEFPDQDLAARLVAWQAGVERLVDLKARIITKINTADPPLKTTALLIRGAGRDLVKAAEDGLTTRLRTDKTELLPWPDVGPQAVEKLIGLVSTPDTADERLAAGVLALASMDPTSAEKLFEQARSLGAEVGPYLAPLAATAFAQARRLIDEKEFAEADELLANLETKHADTTWFRTKRAAFEAAQAKARAGIHEAEAEKLYAEAVDLFKKEQLFDVKPLFEKLKRDYAQSRPVTDAARNPSFAELEQSTANLGRFITVRQDGKGDFTSIQAAIDTAPPNSLIEIEDNGPYNEKIGIGQEGLTIRGKVGFWPIITSVGPVTNFPILVALRAPRTRMERVVLSHVGAAGSGGATACVSGAVDFRSSIVDGGRNRRVFGEGKKAIEECFIIGVRSEGEVSVRNSVWLRYGPAGMVTLVGDYAFENVLVTGACDVGAGTMRFCTIRGPLNLVGTPNRLTDSIVLSIQSSDADATIEYCNVYGNPPFIHEAKPGKGCFALDPQFVNPTHFDYRLRPTSPCIGKASDGGDLGCRFTPKMIEMLNLALELRAKGIIKF